MSPSKQIFKCFGCGAGGDVFTFVQLRESVPFPEAIRILADRAGVDYDRHASASPGQFGRAELARVNDWAANQFRRARNDAEGGRIARDYLVQRKMSADVVERFALGWAPDESGWILAQARLAGVSVPLLKAAGLARDGERGDVYGVFRGRLMFPIRDTMNRVIGFGGRTLKGDRAKYLNTSQNMLFDKGRNLYGIDLARPAMTESRRVVVVEGYTDCMAAHQYGFTNVVATLGTALTDNQINLLRRWCDEIVLVFDSDAAGMAAADRAVGVALRYNLSVRIAHVPVGKDPCDFLETHGAVGFAEMLKSAADALVFKWGRMTERFAGDTEAGRKTAVEEFVALVAEMARFRTVDAIQQGLIVNQLSKLLALPAANVHKLLASTSRAQGAGSHAATSGGVLGSSGGDGADSTRGVARVSSGVGSSGTLSPDALRSSEGWDAEQAALISVLRVLVNEPGYFSDVALVFRPERIRDARARRIASELVALCRTVGEFKLWELMDKFEDPADARFVTDLVYEGAQVGNFEAIIQDTRVRLEQMAPLRRGKQAAAELRRAVRVADGGDEAERLNRIQESLAGAHGFAPGIPASARLDLGQNMKVPRTARPDTAEQG